jgi:hypothetical protein
MNKANKATKLANAARALCAGSGTAFVRFEFCKYALPLRLQDRTKSMQDVNTRWQNAQDGT